jgi:hypothetical protein
MSPSTFEAILQQIAICPEARKKDQNMAVEGKLIQKKPY